MSVQGGYSLSVGHKIKLRGQIIVGARNYNKYLANKIFKIICEDGTDVDIRFFSSDFKHLTGLYSNLNDGEFYQRCFCGTIDVGNIDTNQKYNWSTLKVKGSHIEKIHELLYKDCQKTLLLNLLDTNTYVFPYAVKNIASNMCVGFVSNINKARSLRKASASIKCHSEKPVTAVFAKSLENCKYDELVYISDILGIYNQNEALLDKLDDNIRMKFLEIITKL